MPITFACGCGRQLQVGDEYAGKKARCPECNAVLDVPFADAPPPLPTPAKPPIARAARKVEPEVSADDHGGTAESLDPFEKRSRRKNDEEVEEDRPRNRRRDRDAEDEEDRPRRRRRRYEDDEEDIRRGPPPHKLWNTRVTGGLVSIAIGIVLFGVGLALDRICFWPIIVLVIGVISLITGLVTGRDE